MEVYSQKWLVSTGEMLRRLPCVYAARLLASEDGLELEAIHLLTGVERNPKQIVRDVQSALSAAYGLDIDHRIISVAQMSVNPFEDEQEAASAAPSHENMRPQYCGLRLEEFERRLNVNVTLEYNGKAYEGSASGQSGTLWRDRLVAQAALNAVSALTGGESDYELLVVQPLQTSMLRLTIVLVQCSADGIILTGAAPMEDGSLHGVVRATLDAINRHLSGRLSDIH